MTAEERLKQTTKVSLFCDGEKIVTNDHTHGPHDESNPDDGEISPVAIALGEALKKLGMQVHVNRLD